MSYGIYVCSECSHEVHQDGSRDVMNGWQHCEGHSPMCAGGSAIYPSSTAAIKGRWCGRDAGLDERPSTSSDTPMEAFLPLVKPAPNTKLSAFSQQVLAMTLPPIPPNKSPARLEREARIAAVQQKYGYNRGGQKRIRQKTP